MERIPLLFLLTVLLTLLLFRKASGMRFSVLLLLTGWGILQGIIVTSGFYDNIEARPPRFIFLLLPAVIAAILAVSSTSGRNAVLPSPSLYWLTVLHSVRIPVELFLYVFFLKGLVPQSMTFSGQNPDILIGLSAPVIALLTRNNQRRWLAWGWHIVGLVSLFHIVAVALTSTPYFSAFFSISTPNVAVLQFPYLLLPGIIVPIVLVAHLAALRILWNSCKKHQV